MTPHPAVPVPEHDDLKPLPKRKLLRRGVPWFVPLALFAAVFGLRALTKRAPAFVEQFYSRTIFPRIGRALSLVNGIVGFSLGEIIIVGLVAFLVAAFVYQGLQIYQRRRRPLQVVRKC